MLWRTGLGAGGIALAALSNPKATRGNGAQDGLLDPKPTHFSAKAKSVIFLYMDGGPSQIDTFDPKPRLNQEHGKPFAMKMEPTQFNNNGSTLGCPWKFSQHGESGLPVSELFPHIAKQIDKLAIVRSMTSEFSEHTNANYFLHSGIGIQGRPSMGAWFGYGLGTECQDLPAFVVLNGGLTPPGGYDNFASGFLPAAYQGSIFNVQGPALANVSPLESTSILQKQKLKRLAQMDGGFAGKIGPDDPLEAAIRNYELAFRMQTAVPEVTDLSKESQETLSMYGVDSKNGKTASYARECLLARRMVERGVRFIELTCPNVGHDRWDQHSNLKKGHEDNARAVDQPIAALLADLSRRGLLDSTLVVWGGEFGRTPFAQGSDGRDHNPFGFSIWLAGGGVKGGLTYGATDEYGYKVVENRAEIHDLHATILHLLGMDHKRLTYYYAGRNVRLTDVKGEVLHEILA
jgi:hypothetical protein